MSILQTRWRRIGMSRQSANLLLLLVAMSWGLSYVLLKMGATKLPPFEVLALRFTVASIACVAVFWRRLRHVSRRAVCYGVVLGTLMFACSSAIIFGELTTDASTASFLTSAAIVFVPVMQAIRKRRLPERPVIFGTLCATIGIALLSLKGSLVLSAGASLCILSALLYATHTIITSDMVRQEDAFLLGVIQQLTMAGWGWITTLAFTTPMLPQNAHVWLILVALGLLCGAIPFVVQPFAQSFTTPEHTALILSMEPVFGALFAVLMLSESMSGQAICGAVLVLASVLLTTYRQPKHK